jgi:hypothetical protein
MMRNVRLRFLLLAGFGWICMAAAASRPAADIRILDDGAAARYPIRIVFSIEAESDAQIRVLELEYGLIGRDCTPDRNIVVPEDFSPTGHVDSKWTWEVAASSNILPPGMRIWWDWRLVDAMGNEVRTEKRWLTWIDSIHDWKTLTSENILLHWYRGTEGYNRGFLQAAEDARDFLRNEINAWPSEEINIYIYGSNEEFKDALEGEPDWIGGLSFGANQRTIMIGIAPEYVDWGKTTIAHELAHTAVDSIMGGCFASIPLWLNEGIAMHAEGSLEPEFQRILDDAIYYDSLFSLRSISYEYREIGGDPSQTYAQSYSAVAFLIDAYGRKDIRRLLDLLGEGYTYDNALLAALGVDMDGLEAGWRKAIGADPMRVRTGVPSVAAPLEATIPPGSSSLVLSTNTAVPSPRQSVEPHGSSPGREIPQGAGFTGVLLLLCGLGFCVAGGIGVFGLLFLVRSRNPHRSSGTGSAR